MARIPGFKNLIFDAIEQTTNLVQKTHESVAEKPMRYLEAVEPVATPARLLHSAQRITVSVVYTSIRVVNRTVSNLTDVGVALAESATDEIGGNDDEALATPQRSDAAGTLAWSVDHVEGAINGFVGDFLHARANELNLGMTLRRDGRVLRIEQDALADALPDASTSRSAHGAKRSRARRRCWAPDARAPALARRARATSDARLNCRAR